MERTLVAKLETFVSPPRLQRYRAAATTDLDVVILYGWNIQLAESLMPTLALLEVALRNAVHDTLTDYVGSDYWFKPVLHQEMYDNITDLIARLTRRQGHPPSAEKVISEITFGFWPRLFAKRYNSLWWNPPNALLTQVIPNHPTLARDTRSRFEQRLE